MVQTDAHHHVWRLARGDYHWLTTDLPIHRDYDLADLQPLLGGRTASVLVQAAETEAETAFLLDVASRSEGLVRGVVGWTDLAAEDAATRVADLARASLLRGLRPMLQDMADCDWILGDAVQPALSAMTASGLRLDLLIRTHHLELLPILAARHPGLPMVIDHAAKPDIAGGALGPWAEGIARAAATTTACCKLSGLVTEAGPDWTVERLRPVFHHLLECFGPERLMWGSDWPVVDLAGGMRRWQDATTELLSPLDTASRAAILGGTATRFYGLA